MTYLGRSHCQSAAEIQLAAQLLISVYYPNAELPKNGFENANKKGASWRSEGVCARLLVGHDCWRSLCFGNS